MKYVTLESLTCHFISYSLFELTIFDAIFYVSQIFPVDFLESNISNGL